MFLALGAAMGLSGPVARAAERLVVDAATFVHQDEWKTFRDAGRHFRFEHPASWKVDIEPFPLTHYRLVFCALNSLGKDRFKIREYQTGTNTFEFGVQAITNQLPAGAAYLEGCLDGLHNTGGRCSRESLALSRWGERQS